MICLGKISKENITASTKLRCNVVETILTTCIHSSTFHDLLVKIKKQSISSQTLKKHIFYLIEHKMISYDGQKRFFRTEEEGFYLLWEISKEKKFLKTSSTDIDIILYG